MVSSPSVCGTYLFAAAIRPTVRAVFRLRIVVVRHVGILIYIVICERKLAAIVEVVGAHAVLRNVQLAENRRYLALVEQIEALDVILIAVRFLL